MSKLFRASFLLTVFFGLNKGIALVRQYLTAQQFGLSPQMDAFNVANNVPDLLFSLISGSALALAFIPVLTEYLDKKGEKETWQLFSQIANLVFLSTGVLAAIAFVLAPVWVSSPFGIAPGFPPEQQQLTVSLMRINLIGTLIFSISGLLTAALQAHKHFLLPALSPIMHNVGLLIGLFFFAQSQVVIGPITLPGLGLGIFGLEYGVILGALLHLTIQLPAAFTFKFRWQPLVSLKDPGVMRVLQLMGPRILTVLLIQAIFFTRDNFASRMESGAISALTYGFFLMQVPETLIGTAIGTALLPTLSDYAAEKQKEAFTRTLTATIKIIFASTVMITVLAFLSLDTFLGLVFDLEPAKLELLSWTTKMFFLGLTAHSLLEVTSRAFYAVQNTRTPFWLTIGRVAVFVVSAFFFSASFGAPGLAIADSLAVSTIVGSMLFLLHRSMPKLLDVKGTIARTAVATIITIIIFSLTNNFSPLPGMISVILAGAVSSLIALFILKEEILLIKKV
jgi:putative peptidoglycan lipid II flippase